MEFELALKEFTFNRIEDILTNEEHTLIQEAYADLDRSLENLGFNRDDSEKQKEIILSFVSDYLIDTQFHLIYKLAFADIMSQQIVKGKLYDLQKLMESNSALEDFIYNQVEILLGQDNKIMQTFYHEFDKKLINLGIDINNCDQLKLAVFNLIANQSQLIYKQALIDGISIIFSARETKDLLGIEE